MLDQLQIASAQLRPGALLAGGDGEAARRYTEAGLTMARTPSTVSATAPPTAC